MKLRSTLILLALFLLGLGALWWAEIREIPTDRDLRARQSLVFPELSRTSPGEVLAVEVDRQGGSDRVLARRRIEGGWQLQEPLEALADPNLLETLIRNVLSLRKSPDAGTITGNAGRFGLSPPSATLRLLGADTSRPLATLRIGNRVGNRLYVSPGSAEDDAIEVVDVTLLSATLLPVAQWRDLALSRVPSFRVASLTVKQADPAQTVELSREDRRWRMLEPLKTPADPDRVEALVVELSALRVADETAGFVADDVTDLVPFGLEAPSYTFTVTPFRDGGPPQSIRIGNPVPDHPDQRFALRVGQNDVVRVDARRLLESYQGVSWLRSKQVADIAPQRVYRLAVDTIGRSFDLARTTKGWRRLRPTEAKADALEVEKLLTTVASLETSEFLDPSTVPDPGLDPPFHRIRIWQYDPGGPNPSPDISETLPSVEPRLDLVLGRHDPIRKTIYGRIAGDDTILALPDTVRNILPANAFAYRDLTILNFNPSEVDRITVERPGRSLTIQAPGSGTRATSWRLSEPVDAPADEQAVTALLVSLSSLRAESWESETVANPSAFGFDPPGLRIRWLPRPSAIAKAEEAPRVLRIGRPKPGTQSFYANIEGEAAVFSVGPGDIAALDAELHDPRILSFDPDQTRRIILRWPERSLALVNRGTDWRVDQGYDPSGFDPGPMDELNKAVSKLATSRFLHYDGPIPPTYGFDPPRLSLEIEREGVVKPLTLLVGSALTTSLSVATTGDGKSGATFVLNTEGPWESLLRPPSRIGELPADVFAPGPKAANP